MTAGVAMAQPPCRGDCNRDGTVVISELVLGVNIALGRNGVGACTAIDVNGDDRVSVDELIVAVNNLLHGCGDTGGSCPLDFTSDFQNTSSPRFCAFTGGWNSGCGHHELQATFFTARDAEATVVTAVIFTTPPVFFAGLFDSTTHTRLERVGLVEDAPSAIETGGTMELTNGGRTLIIMPDPVPFNVDDCPFVRYEGVFSGIRDRPTE
jgi:hypothetical protein